MKESFFLANVHFVMAILNLTSRIHLASFAAQTVETFQILQFFIYHNLYTQNSSVFFICHNLCISNSSGCLSILICTFLAILNLTSRVHLKSFAIQIVETFQILVFICHNLYIPNASVFLSVIICALRILQLLFIYHNLCISNSSVFLSIVICTFLAILNLTSHVHLESFAIQIVETFQILVFICHNLDIPDSSVFYLS